ncbi:hypothetical protein amb3381 [Paramagnetospirillum magneticum AMB-1]|uniref:Uncharacterized protein n=2 Tax=Paramagnetospirillum magneticum TaxID=84159 RepID=Q2W1U0_PARM1|nr:hypothetical protein amb3381 [Paramagnetospirillum magneticum AMB-1]
MLVALPSAIAFGVTIFAPLGGSLAAQGAWPAFSAPPPWGCWPRPSAAAPG